MLMTFQMMELNKLYNNILKLTKSMRINLNLFLIIKIKKHFIIFTTQHIINVKKSKL